LEGLAVEGLTVGKLVGALDGLFVAGILEGLAVDGLTVGKLVGALEGLSVILAHPEVVHIQVLR